MYKTILLLLLSCSLLGCSKRNNEREWWNYNSKLKILSTISMIHDFVQEIGGEYVDAAVLIRGELDPHSYELVKGDDEKFERATIVFCNGLGLEHSLSLRQKIATHPCSIAVADILLKKEPSLLLCVENQYDPHVWMDITLWMHIIEPIVHALAEADPDHALIYEQRGRLLSERLEQTDRVLYQKMQAIPSELRYLITSHDAFHYFTRRYLANPNEMNWKERCAAPEGLAPESQLSITDIYEIVHLIEKRRVPVLFPESNMSKDALRKIVKVGLEKGYYITLSKEPLYGDSMGSATSYLDMMSHNVRVITEELQQAQDRMNTSSNMMAGS